MSDWWPHYACASMCTHTRLCAQVERADNGEREAEGAAGRQGPLDPDAAGAARRRAGTSAGAGRECALVGRRVARAERRAVGRRAAVGRRDAPHLRGDGDDAPRAPRHRADRYGRLGDGERAVRERTRQRARARRRERRVRRAAAFALALSGPLALAAAHTRCAPFIDPRID